MFRNGGAGKRRDQSEKAIKQALEAVGATVIQISGKGAPDLFVCYRGQMWGAEVKSGKGTLTEAQKDLGAGRLWPIWRTPEDALQTIGASR